MEDIGYSTEFLKDLKKAQYEEFIEKVAFLEEEPLTGLLLPET